MPETESKFTIEDIDETIALLIEAAVKERVIQIGDVLILGMNQSQSRDWEDWSEFVNDLELRDMSHLPETPKLIEKWHRERAEAARENAVDDGL